MQTENKDKAIILVVEDEETLAVGLEYNLVEEGYRIVRARDGRQAVEQFAAQAVDLVILDIMLPFLDGFTVAKKIREISSQVPILMLTARTTPPDRIRGLEIGADDYLTKPFHLKELLLRVKGMLKRQSWYQQNLENSVYVFGENRIDFSNCICTRRDEVIRMTALETALLRYLVRCADQTVTRQELLEHVWKAAPDVETRTVDNFVVRLRRHIEPYPSKPVYIRSVRGVGYRFTPNGQTEH